MATLISARISHLNRSLRNPDPSAALHALRARPGLVKYYCKFSLGIHSGVQPGTSAYRSMGAPGREPMVTSIAEWDKEMQDKTRGPLIIAYAKKTHNDDLLKFLSLMKAKKYDKSTYDLYIKDGAPKEVNIDSSLRSKFDPNNLAGGPWAAVTTEILKLYTENVSKKAK
jgi:hypothetical protein